jgi:Na+/H+ antiporter NhaD/arsenite permease-like protein
VTVALVVFVVTYVAIAGLRLPWVLVDRPAAAMCGAVAMVAFGVLSVDEAYAAVHMDTVALLLGMMIIAAYLTEAAFFRNIAWFVVTRARSARSLLWMLVFVSGGLSALLVNDTVCLMFTPLVLAVILEADLPALPYLLALATATNLGGLATYTGNPQNMIVGASPGAPSYLVYLAHAAPVALLSLAADAALLGWLFRRELPAGPLKDRSPPRAPLDRVLAAKALAALVLFVVLAVCGFRLAGAAMAAAALLIVLARHAPRKALERVDWILLLFFAGLFVVVRGVEKSGALQLAFDRLTPLFARGDLVGTLSFSGFVVIASNLISNVPLVLVAVKLVPKLPDPAGGYILLAMTSTLAGNLTLFGSMANLIVFESAGERGKIGFRRFAGYGVIVTTVTLVIALGLLWLERSLFSGAR